MRISDWSSDVCSSDLAVGLGQGIEVELLLDVVVTELLDAHLRRAAIEQAQHDLLAKQGGAGGHAEIHLGLFRDLELDAAILRHPLFGDIEPLGKASCRARVCQYV